MKVLVVDDSKDFRDSMAELLRQYGHTAVTVGRLTEAQRLLAEEDPDVILLDLAMPDRAGRPEWESLVGGARKVPVVILTGHVDVPPVPPDIPVLVKPADPEEVLRTLEERARQRQRERAGGQPS